MQYYDEKRGVVTAATTEAPADPENANSITLIGRTATTIQFTDGLKTVEQWTLPCPTLVSQKDGLLTTRQLVVRTGLERNGDGVKYEHTGSDIGGDLFIFEVRTEKTP